MVEGCLSRGAGSGRAQAAAVALLLLAGPAWAGSTINTTLPAQGAYNAAPIRQNFQAAANDINALFSMNAGASAPSSPSSGTLWLDTTTTTYVLKVWVAPSSAWVPIARLSASAGSWMPPVGGGAIPSIVSASTTDLGSVGQAAVNITGSQSIASFGSNVPEGQIKFLVFTGSPTLVYNATFMILPGATNLTVSAGETVIALSLGSGRWRVGFGDVTACTLFSSVTTGCVPASGGGTSTFLRADGTWAAAGSVSSVGLSVPGSSLFGVTGSPVTGSGTLGLTTTGTSGGIPYFSSTSQLATSGALTANLPVIGGGAGAAPSVGTRSGNTTSFATTTGALTSGYIAQWDASGNLVAGTGVGCIVPTSPAVLYSAASACAGDATNFFWTPATRTLKIIGNTGSTLKGLATTIVGGTSDHYGALWVCEESNCDGAGPGGHVAIGYNRDAGKNNGSIDSAVYNGTFTATPLELQANTGGGAPVYIGHDGGLVPAPTAQVATKNRAGVGTYADQYYNSSGSPTGGFFQDASNNGELHVCTDSTGCGAAGASAAVRLRSSGFSWFRGGDVSFAGTSALATNAVVGFPMAPQTAGIPSGAPTNASAGAAPFIIDSSDNRLYWYSGGAWRYAAAAGGASAGTSTDTFLYPAITNSSIFSADGSEVHCQTTPIAMTTGDSYNFRAVLSGWASASKGTGIFILNGNTSAAKGYLATVDSASNLILYTYDNTAYSAKRSTGAGQFNQAPSVTIVDFTITVGSAANMLTFNTAGSTAVLGDGIVAFGGGNLYVCPMAPAYSNIGKVQVQKLS